MGLNILPGTNTMFGSYGPQPVGVGNNNYANALSQYGAGQPHPLARAIGQPSQPYQFPSFSPNVGAGSPTLAGAAGAGTPATTTDSADPTAKSGFFGSTFGNGEGGIDIGKLGDLTKILGSFGGMYLAHQSNGLAQDTLDFQRQAYATNLRNQTQSYNQELEDRVRSRFNDEGGTRRDANRYMRNHRLEG